MSVEQTTPNQTRNPKNNKNKNKNLGYTIACTRYNTQTWKEYQEWKTSNQREYEAEYKKPLKCIYGSPREISSRKIAPNSKILIIEMHNDENKIMGIGMIENKTASEVYRSKSKQNAPTLPKLPTSPTTSTAIPPQGGGTPNGTPNIKYNIFSDRNYNRYIFIGNEFYISREDMERNIEYSELIEKIRKLDTLLFKGPRHSKRGSGFTKLAEWIIDAGYAIKI